MNVGYSLAIIAVVSLCTIFLRAVPFLLFGGNKEVPKAVQYLGAALPPAIMTVLVIYCMRSITFKSPEGWVPEILASMFVVGLHIWKKNILLSIGLGTAFYMILVQVIFV